MAFVEYEGQYGWIQMVSNDGETLCKIPDLPVADKPVIYLYPEEETDVHIELELTAAELSTTYPKYNNGWDVVAYPDGTLLNKADGSHHRYLFWDAVNCHTHFDFSKGFCIADSDTESFLKEKLTYMGLSEEEMNEFIVYWLPLMEHNAYNLISFQSDAYTDTARSSSVSAAQPAKAPLTSTKESGNVTEVSPVKPAKAAPSSTKVSGNVTEVSPVQPENASVSIYRRPSGRSTDLREVHPEKAPTPIVSRF